MASCMVSADTTVCPAGKQFSPEKIPQNARFVQQEASSEAVDHDLVGIEGPVKPVFPKDPVGQGERQVRKFEEFVGVQVQEPGTFRVQVNEGIVVGVGASGKRVKERCQHVFVPYPVYGKIVDAPDIDASQ